MTPTSDNWHGTVDALLKADLFDLLQGLTNIGRSFSGLSKSETTSSTVFPFFKDFTLRRSGLNLSPLSSSEELNFKLRLGSTRLLVFLRLRNFSLSSVSEEELSSR
jgi:hypothetical protein